MSGWLLLNTPTPQLSDSYQQAVLLGTELARLVSVLCVFHLMAELYRGLSLDSLDQLNYLIGGSIQLDLYSPQFLAT